jgi:hypothetical protein
MGTRGWGACLGSGAGDRRYNKRGAVVVRCRRSSVLLCVRLVAICQRRGGRHDQTGSGRVSRCGCGYYTMAPSWRLRVLYHCARPKTSTRTCGRKARFHKRYMTSGVFVCVCVCVFAFECNNVAKQVRLRLQGNGVRKRARARPGTRSCPS